MIRRLQRHAARFHRHASKLQVVRKYAAAVDHLGTASLRQHAAHVAAWIAYAPAGSAPSSAELELLAQMASKLGTGPLPGRLRLVLPAVQASLRSLPPPSEDWEVARSNLQKRLLRFRCCRLEDAAAGSDRAQQGKEATVSESTALGSAKRMSGDGPSVPGCSRIFRKMNLWANMEPEEKAKCLEEAEAITQDMAGAASSEAELRDVISQAAGALAPPRMARSQAGDADGCDAGAADAQAPRGLSANLQRQVRALLLGALRAWQSQEFDPRSIHEELCYLQTLIRDFEEKQAELSCAAARSAWLALKHVLAELQTAEDEPMTATAKKGHANPSDSSRENKQAVMDRLMRALGGQATLKQLVSYVQQHPDEVADSSALAKRLRRSGASEFFSLRGRREDGQAIYALSEPRPKGVRRLRGGFAARTHLRDHGCECFGPCRARPEVASRDYARLQAWKATLAPEDLVERVRRWKGARVTSAKDCKGRKRENL